MPSTKPISNKAGCGNKSKPMLQAVFLAPYLPFKLQGHYLLSDVVNTPKNELRDKLLTIDNFDFFLKYATPKLKLLGDLTKDEKTCDEINEILKPNGLEINNFLLLKNSLSAVAISWEEMQNVLNVLYREHYDVFGLINKRLAVSVHDVV